MVASGLSKISDEYDYIEPSEAKTLLDAIETQLNNSFQAIRNLKYNPNTKGYDYEGILKKFFEDYLGNAFEFLTRVGVIDNELKMNSTLISGENEFDVVAIHKNAVPKIVINRFVPFDSVAFITEVKQTLTVENLESDLIKLGKLSLLKVSDRSQIGNLPSNFNIEKMRRPLRLLFYYEQKADFEKVKRLLEVDYKESWDLFVVLTQHLVICNTTMPLITNVMNRNAPMMDYGYPLLKGMFFACISTGGVFVDSWLVFWNLFRSIAPRPQEAK
ncbi:MAG TPA: DUF6602 domain-containing protein [Candidatus Bathyarchaeia archaeon]|nr:DUF6602 domain-containing protein [Candidatus Bathyarchaeia archaeon]